jgi:hypothetical protein
MDVQPGFLLETIRVRDGVGRALLALNFLVTAVPHALAYDLAGKPASSSATRWKFTALAQE